jgi:hypothetical protein
MANGTVVLVGDLPIERLGFDRLVSEFGWSSKRVESLCGLGKLSADHDLVTVLFDPKSLALPWEKALSSVIAAAPRALPILCHGFAEIIDLSRVAEAGAFHSLLVPLRASEVRLSLGFVWCAQRPSTPILTHPFPRRHRALSERPPLKQIHAVA